MLFSNFVALHAVGLAKNAPDGSSLLVFRCPVINFLANIGETLAKTNKNWQAK